MKTASMIGLGLVGYLFWKYGVNEESPTIVRESAQAIVIYPQAKAAIASPAEVANWIDVKNKLVGFNPNPVDIQYENMVLNSKLPNGESNAYGAMLVANPDIAGQSTIYTAIGKFSGATEALKAYMDMNYGSTGYMTA